MTRPAPDRRRLEQREAELAAYREALARSPLNRDRWPDQVRRQVEHDEQQMTDAVTKARRQHLEERP